MAEIIGYDKAVFKKYNGICKNCGAIIIFEESELHDQYQYTDYCYSSGKCPGCGNTVSLDKNKSLYSEESQFYGWPKTTNCKKNKRDAILKFSRSKKEKDKLVIKEVSEL